MPVTAAVQDAIGANLDPGIRRTVAQLRAWGYDTTDSGDGRAKFAAGTADECTLKMPHVFCAVTPENMIAEASRLESLLRTEARSRGKLKDYPWRVEATFWPASDCAMVQVFDLDDDWWEAGS